MLACEINSDSSDTSKRSWVYTAPQDVEDVHHWIRETFSIRHAPFSAEEFVLERNRTRTSYLHADGHAQIVHFYLLFGDDGVHALFMHGQHAVMDARPTLRGLDLLLGWIADPPKGQLEDLDWGEEWVRLPAGPWPSHLNRWPKGRLGDKGGGTSAGKCSCEDGSDCKFLVPNLSPVASFEYLFFLISGPTHYNLLETQ